MILDLNNPLHQEAIEEALIYMARAREPQYEKAKDAISKLAAVAEDRPDKLDMAIRALKVAAALEVAEQSTDKEREEARLYYFGIRPGWGYEFRHTARDR